MLGRRTSLATFATTAAVGLGTLGLAVAAPGQPEPPELTLRSAQGALTLASPQDGQTLFAAGGMRPGGGTFGTLVMRNTGDEPAVLSLRATGALDTPGAGGGRLSDVLLVTVARVDGGPTTLWTGTATALSGAALGVLGPGEQRTLRVSAQLPAAVGNAYQGAALSVGLEWAASRVPVVPTPTPTPTPTTTTPAPTQTTTTTPPTTPVVTPPPTTPGADTPLDVSPEVLGLPSAKACLSRRNFRIHVRGPRGAAIAAVTVKAGSKRARTVAGRGRHTVAARVDLRGVTKRKVTVALQVRTTDGRLYRSKRTYKICAGR